ncbi:bifunctional lysylphosphatidylglycerol flippase/synthetase MprF [Streptomyces longisporoflavus]|uniref:Bifunctional lysylphosphatidylglycerol flippase/synthetase MprF n=1 Tax=Streptomyces longisporoflavus TaxID=28044 RepID=A0ABW7QUQ8_9ACTN
MSRVRDTSQESAAAALAAVQRYADNPSAFLALNTGNELFLGSGGELIAYREAGRFFVQFGGVFGPEDRQEAVLREFRKYARERRRTITGIQLQRADAELYEAAGFVLNQVGSSYAVHLPEFTLRGPRFMKLRNKISRATRSGLDVREVAFTDHRAGIEEIDAAWLRAKGRHVKEIEFLVGEIGGPAQRYRRLFLGMLDGRPVAYISYSPAYGTRPGWLHDLSRRRPDAGPGVMEAVNAAAIQAFSREGAEWLHFGFTPFTGLDASRELASRSALTGKFLRFLAEKGEAVYPAGSQLAYKEKWGPQLVLPEYLAFEGSASLRAVWHILRVTKSI